MVKPIMANKEHLHFMDLLQAELSDAENHLAP